VPDDVLRGHIRALRGLTANPLDLLSDALMELAKRNADARWSADEANTQCSDTSRPMPAREP